MTNSFGIVNLAIEVAVCAHQEQSRKGTKIPYISHHFSFGMILAQAGYDEELVTAGILHDVVEDTRVSLMEIEQVLEHRVAEIAGSRHPEKCDKLYERWSV